IDRAYSSGGPTRTERNRSRTHSHDLVFLVFPSGHGPAHDLREADGFAAPRQAMRFVDLVAVAHERARITDQLPTDQSSNAAVHGTAEHALDRMLPQDAKEDRCLDVL